MWVRIPSRTSWVRLSRSAIRCDCSLWRNRPPNRSLQRRVERLLARVTEGRVAGVVAEPDRLDEILVQPERTGDDAGDPGRLERVGHPGPVVVAGRVDEDLRLALQAPERLGMDDPVAVALERRADAALLLGRDAGRGSQNDRTASGESASSSSRRDPFCERGRPCRIGAGRALVQRIAGAGSPSAIAPARPLR